MKVVYHISFLFILACPFGATCQVDSLLSTSNSISICRQNLLQAFELDDRLETQYWLDSLQRLEDSDYLALQWDERWLFYIWLENYSPLFAEVVQFDKGGEEATLFKIPPPPDSLFKSLDAKLFRNQSYLFEQIQIAWLSTEERAFAALLVNYLLRMSIDEPEASEFDAQLRGFLKQFPNSRFRPFIKKRMFTTQPPGKWAVGFDVLLLQGSWSGALERSLRPLFGADIGFTYWRKGWNTSIRMAVGGQKLDQDIEENQYFWLKDDPSTFFAVELETGYDVLNKSRLRIFPSIGGGFGTIHPPTNEDNPPPDYYDFFRFNGWHLEAAIQADVKFNIGNGNIASSYHGVRLRLGHRWLQLSEGNPAMMGNMFFVAVGYSFFARQPEP